MANMKFNLYFRNFVSPSRVGDLGLGSSNMVCFSVSTRPQNEPQDATILIVVTPKMDPKFWETLIIPILLKNQEIITQFPFLCLFFPSRVRPVTARWKLQGASYLKDGLKGNKALKRVLTELLNGCFNV